MSTSLQRQLTRRVLLATLALSAATGSGLYLYARSALTREFDATTTGKAGAFQSLLEIEPNGKLEVEFTAESLPDYYAKSPDRFFELHRGDGTLYVGSPALNGRPLLPPHIPPTPRGGFDLNLPNGKRGRGIIVRFEPWPELPDPHTPRILPADLEDFTLVLARDRAELDQTLATLLTGLLLAGITLAGGTTLAVVLVVRRGLRSVQAVADEAAHIDATSLDRRLPVAGLADELRPICQCINDLLTRVEAGFKRERQFTANVAHELRTPIAELRAMAEVALQRSSMHGTPPDQKDIDALDIALQMEAIVTTLLSLARCHAGTLVAQPVQVDLGELVNASWRKVARSAELRGLKADITLPPHATITADRSLLAAMLDNLFANAVDYAPRGCAVRCDLTRTSDRVTLRIANSAAGLTAADVARMCEPFWRKDGVRTSSTHSGLGLALVEAYAKLLNVTLDLRLAPDDLLVVSLTFAAPTAGASSELNMTKDRVAPELMAART
jgi:two-component system sensor histidine kinase QseC